MRHGAADDLLMTTALPADEVVIAAIPEITTDRGAIAVHPQIAAQMKQ